MSDAPVPLSPGPELALLLLGGFRVMVDAATAELARRGHPGIHARQEFAMRAVESGICSAGDLARHLGISKQAAAKTIKVLERRGYLSTMIDPADARRKQLALTPRGSDMLKQGRAVLDAFRQTWAERVGAHVFADMELALRAVMDRSTAIAADSDWLNSLKFAVD